MARKSLSAALSRAVRNLALVRVDRFCDPHPLVGMQLEWVNGCFSTVWIPTRWFSMDTAR